ncbi:MAG TPA: sigma-70 family RNA polymerase sigma factor [Polyangiaceae bacterium]|jgi:RNA polymerase sigma-70 factor (ECF subfamily)
MLTKPLPEDEPSLLLARDAPTPARFEGGERSDFEAFYREHFALVDRAVGRVLAGADKETVVHEVFLRLMSNAALRLEARGASLPAWLSTVARNQAIDYHRRRRFEQPAAPDQDVPETGQDAERFERRAEARLLIERFRSEHLPAKWTPVFELRFIRQLGQVEAARELGISRTTLAYQEYRIRALLRRFLLKLDQR